MDPATAVVIVTPSPAPDRDLLVLHLRPARRRAREAAIAEAVAALADDDAVAEVGGPLAEQKDVAWVSVRAGCGASLPSRSGFALGYTRAIDLVTRWHRRDHSLVRVVDEPDGALRDLAPDRRSFLLVCADGVVRRITGYRGGEGPLEHRALPVVDARLLVNLVGPPGSCRGRVLLDPFAGAGGVLHAACAAGWTSVVGVDVDPSLRFGLAEASDGRHVVGDASCLPFADASVDAVATEPPYHSSAIDAVVAAVGEVARVLVPRGRAALLVAADHAAAVVAAAGGASMDVDLCTPIDRKGTPVVCIRLVRR